MILFGFQGPWILRSWGYISESGCRGRRDGPAASSYFAPPLPSSHPHAPVDSQLTPNTEPPMARVPPQQDLPPAAGFPTPVRYARNLPRRGPSGAVILVVGVGVMAYGFSQIGKLNEEKR